METGQKISDRHETFIVSNLIADRYTYFGKPFEFVRSEH
jgi:hypothetical protein